MCYSVISPWSGDPETVHSDPPCAIAPHKNIGQHIVPSSLLYPYLLIVTPLSGEFRHQLSVNSSKYDVLMGKVRSLQDHRLAKASLSRWHHHRRYFNPILLITTPKNGEHSHLLVNYQSTVTSRWKKLVRSRAIDRVLINKWHRLPSLILNLFIMTPKSEEFRHQLPVNYHSAITCSLSPFPGTFTDENQKL